MKKLATAVLTAAAAVSMSVTSFAGVWSWIDVNGDGVQECYYFTEDGNYLKSTTTPDGYQVNAEGQWTENGVVQTKGSLTAAAAQSSTGKTYTDDYSGTYEYEAENYNGDKTGYTDVVTYNPADQTLMVESYWSDVDGESGGVSSCVYKYSGVTELGTCFSYETAEEKGSVWFAAPGVMLAGDQQVQRN